MLLLDTHVWWWSVSEPERLSHSAIQKIRLTRPSQRAIASISLWELAMLEAKQRIELDIPVATWLSRAVKNTGIRVIDLSPDIAAESCSLPGNFHKDPADRIIVATARVHGLILMTKDGKILEYEHVESLW